GMTGNSADRPSERLALRSQISELAQIYPWIDSLAVRHGIPEGTAFAMKLCLEEILSNVIRHGYSSEPGRPISVQFDTPRTGHFFFIIKDQPPPFNPGEAPELPAVNPIKGLGGQGIRLLREFADTLEYFATQTGNQLRVGFFADRSA